MTANLTRLIKTKEKERTHSRAGKGESHPQSSPTRLPSGREPYVNLSIHMALNIRSVISPNDQTNFNFYSYFSFYFSFFTYLYFNFLVQYSIFIWRILRRNVRRDEEEY